MKSLLRSLAAELALRLPRGAFLDRKYFHRYQSKGIHVVPTGFYFPIPDTASIPEKIWTEPSEMVGVDMRLDAQVAMLQEFSDTYLGEYHQLPEGPCDDPKIYTRTGGAGFFGAFDGALLYSMIRKHKPRKIIEIGCGKSTLLSALALRKNRDDGSTNSGRLTSIDPYPRDYLSTGLEDVADMVCSKVEDMPISTFESLEANDILFIDSSHTVHVGGDTVFELLEILPRLKPGVLVHVHDICFPYNYPKNMVVEKLNFWAEQYMLQAFLAFNSSFEVRWSLTYLQENRPDVMKSAFPYFEQGKRKMGSFWMQRVS